jgi:hypothetical protein
MARFAAVQNEVEYEDTVKLVGKGVKLVLEGANMPTSNDGINFLHSKGCVLAPAKACNAGAACCRFVVVLQLWVGCDVASTSCTPWDACSRQQRPATQVRRCCRAW